MEDLPSAPRFDLTVDDTKVSGHTAILPTRNVDRTVLDGLSGDERLTLVRVVRRMWEATADDYVHDTVQVIANLNPHWCESHPDEGCRLSEGECRFTSRSDQPVSLGWKAIEPAKADRGDDADEEEASSARNVIPVNLSTGVSLRPVSESSVSEGRTKPPKPFTEATLLAAMEHASRYVEDKDLKAALDDDESHSGGIGTPATRADVIEKLVHAGYMERKGKQLHSTEAGRTLVDVVSPRLRDVSLTADMERSLGDVERGGAHADAVYEEFRGYARAIPADAAANVKAERVGQSGGKTESYGRCPQLRRERRKRGQDVDVLDQPQREAGRRHMETEPMDAGTGSSRRSRARPSPMRRCGRSSAVRPSSSKDSHRRAGKNVRRPAGRRQGNAASRSISANDRKHVDAVHRSSIRNMIGLTMWMGTGRMQSRLECRKTPLPKKRKRRLPKVIRDEQSKGGRVRPQIRKGC